MSDYCKCKDCKYCDTKNKDGYKIHCEWYGTYEDPDEVKECRHYTEN